MLRHDIVSVTRQQRKMRKIIAGERGNLKGSVSCGNRRLHRIVHGNHNLARRERPYNLKHLLRVQYIFSLGHNVCSDNRAHTLFQIVYAQPACARLFPGTFKKYTVDIRGGVSSRYDTGCGY